MTELGNALLQLIADNGEDAVTMALDDALHAYHRYLREHDTRKESRERIRRLAWLAHDMGDLRRRHELV